MANPPVCHDNQPDQPRAALNNHHLGQLPGARLPSGIEGPQTRGKEVRIPAPVRMIRPDESPAAAPEFASLGFVHLVTVMVTRPCDRCVEHGTDAHGSRRLGPTLDSEALPADVNPVPLFSCSNRLLVLLASLDVAVPPLILAARLLRLALVVPMLGTNLHKVGSAAAFFSALLSSLMIAAVASPALEQRSWNPCLRLRIPRHLSTRCASRWLVSLPGARKASDKSSDNGPRQRQTGRDVLRRQSRSDLR